MAARLSSSGRWSRSATPMMQQRFDARGRRLERQIFRPVGENRPEHEAEEAGVLVGELDIGQPRPGERRGAAGRALHRRAKLAETLRRDGSQEIVLAGEMAVGGGRRHADTPRGLPQPDRLQAVLIQDLTGRRLKRGGQVAMTIRAGRMHADFAFRAEFTASMRLLEDRSHAHMTSVS